MIAFELDDTMGHRLREIEAAIAEQRRELDRTTDPALRAVATRTLGALGDMLLIMRRTYGPPAGS